MKGSKRVTVRAAPGYRPVIEQPIGSDSPNVRVTLEGIHFRNFTLPGFHIVRLANCSVEGKSFNIGLQGDAKQPAEVLNCLFLGDCTLFVPPGARVTMRNCASGALGIAGVPEGESSVQLERCLVWHKRPGQHGLALGGNEKGTVVLSARDTWFETDEALFSCADFPRLRWEGARNIYTKGQRGWFYTSGQPWPASLPNPLGTDLAAWKQAWKSPEEGSGVAEPLDYTPQQWRLLPQSPGYHQGSGGKDYGADVDQVGRIPTGK
jgi:hypothetical protein